MIRSIPSLKLPALLLAIVLAGCTPSATPASITTVPATQKPPLVLQATATPTAEPSLHATETPFPTDTAPTEWSSVSLCSEQPEPNWAALGIPPNTWLVIPDRDGNGLAWSEMGGDPIARQDVPQLRGMSVLGISPNGQTYLAFRQSTGDPAKLELVVVPSSRSDIKILAKDIQLPAEARWINNSTAALFDEFMPTRLFDVETGESTTLPEPGGIVNLASVFFSPDGHRLLALDQPNQFEWYVYDYTDNTRIDRVFPWIASASIAQFKYLTDVRAGWFSSGLAVIRQNADDLWIAVDLSDSDAVNGSYRPSRIQMPWPGLRTGILAWGRDGKFLLLTRFSTEFGLTGPNHVIGLDTEKHILEFMQNRK